MSLYITSLNSGSNGNCYYVGNHNEAILVDAGISCREIEKRMRQLNLSMQKLKAVFISHEHSDHIKGLKVLSKKYQLPVYITAPTLQNCFLQIENHLVNNFCASETITIGSLNINAFSKHHDACDPYSFTISCGEINIGVFTDLGICCENLIKHFKQCHAAFLEANYDAQMLENGRYPYFLKRRITSGHGHLSNVQALELFINHKAPYMSHLLLSHLSKDNNDPELVENLFKNVAGNTFIKVASRHEETALYYVSNTQNMPEVYNFDPSLYQPEQLNLF